MKNSLYVHARFQDLEKYWQQQPGHENRKHQGWLITNTRFTTDAIDYATCAGLRLLSWDFPNGNALRDQISEYHHYPISCINILQKAEVKILADNDRVTVDDLIDDPTSLALLELSETRRKHIIEEAKMLISK